MHIPPATFAYITSITLCNLQSKVGPTESPRILFLAEHSPYLRHLACEIDAEILRSAHDGDVMHMIQALRIATVKCERLASLTLKWMQKCEGPMIQYY